ncbi:hypothetical protein VZT92_005010 [Zoarces viviparus]|uniref:Uncharacterized protein n=1 Tax=Zoarces viviparus TaxID=48416 RepID=A0AAW1FTL8_ZOAVI
MSSGTGAQNSAALPPLRDTCTLAALNSEQTHRRRAGKLESEAQGQRGGGVGVWEDKERVRFLSFLND